ncbi:MAG: GNAT family N-acetyltransferase [Bacteroidia bacterium]
MKFEHYTLRPPVLKDSLQLLEMMQDNRARLLDYFPVSAGSMKDISSTKKYISEKIKQAKAKEILTFIIYDNTQSRPIGMIFIKSIDWSIPKAELAYFIDKKYEGQGIISKGLKHIIAYCFDTLKMNKLFLRVAFDNIGSQRVAVKNGFVLEGKLRNDFKKADGGLINLNYYGLIKEDLASH